MRMQMSKFMRMSADADADADIRGNSSEHDMQEVRGGITFHKFPVHDKEWYRPVGRPLKTTDYGLVRPNIQHSNF